MAAPLEHDVSYRNAGRFLLELFCLWWLWHSSTILTNIAQAMGATGGWHNVSMLVYVGAIMILMSQMAASCDAQMTAGQDFSRATVLFIQFYLGCKGTQIMLIGQIWFFGVKKVLRPVLKPMFVVTMIMNAVEITILVVAMVLAQQEGCDEALILWAVLPVFVFGLRLYGGYKHRPNQSEDGETHDMAMLRLKFLDKRHMTERYGLLVLITIGEIVSAAAAANEFGDDTSGEFGTGGGRLGGWVGACVAAPVLSYRIALTPPLVSTPRRLGHESRLRSILCVLSALCIFLDYFWSFPEEAVGVGDLGMGGILITMFQFGMIAALTAIGAGFRVAIELAGEGGESEEEHDDALSDGSEADDGEEDEEHAGGSESINTRLLLLAGLGFYLLFSCGWRSRAADATFFRVSYYLRLMPLLVMGVAVIVTSVFRDALVPADDTSSVCIFTTCCLAATAMWNLGCLVPTMPELDVAGGHEPEQVQGQGQGQEAQGQGQGQGQGECGGAASNPLADGELHAQLGELAKEKALLERRLEASEEEKRQLRERLGVPGQD